MRTLVGPGMLGVLLAVAACSEPQGPRWCRATYHFSNVPYTNIDSLPPIDSLLASSKPGVEPDSVTVEYCEG